MMSLQRVMNLSMMSCPGAEWRCVLEGGMEQCVMTPGTMKMPLLSADSWDSHNMVSTKKGEHKSNLCYL